MDLIDTHQHLILRNRLGYAWADAIPALAGRDFDRADYAALVAGQGITATIFMETGVDDACYRDEARLVAGMVGQGGMLGQIASCRPEEDAGFDAWLEECRTLGVVGFRRITHVVPDEVSQAQTFRRNIRRIGAAGWPVDLCFLSRQLPLCEALVRACPDVYFVLDHCGTPDIAGGDFDAWRQRMARLAVLPNLWVKLSGIAAYAAPGAGIAAVRPYADEVLRLFGPGRMLWGGDWPVVNLGAGLPGWIAMTRQLLAGLSEDEQAQIGHRNARAVYLGG
ncbi:MAG: amidohydrolase [Fuscovulum sp.]|nr:amidohydrolase [Fuscovulum sp.]